eukprot:4077817-Prymnesium_polylepis.1
MVSSWYYSRLDYQLLQTPTIHAFHSQPFERFTPHAQRVLMHTAMDLVAQPSACTMCIRFANLGTQT